SKGWPRPTPRQQTTPEHQREDGASEPGRPPWQSLGSSHSDASIGGGPDNVNPNRASLLEFSDSDRS
ncbi:MAG: hypothetical protein WBZ07_09775, partial [Candidatus Dormiibacterota bacterium]